MTTSDRFNAAIQAAWRNRDYPTELALKALRDQVMPKPPLMKLAVTTDDATYTFEVDRFTYIANTITASNNRGQAWHLTGVQHLTVERA